MVALSYDWPDGPADRLGKPDSLLATLEALLLTQAKLRLRTQRHPKAMRAAETPSAERRGQRVSAKAPWL